MGKVVRQYKEFIICGAILLFLTLFLLEIQRMYFINGQRQLNIFAVDLILGLILTLGTFLYAKIKNNLYLWTIAFGYFYLTILHLFNAILGLKNYYIIEDVYMNFLTSISIIPDVIISIVIIVSCLKKFNNKILKKKYIKKICLLIIILAFINSFINLYLYNILNGSFNTKLIYILNVINILVDFIITIFVWNKYCENKDIFTLSIMINYLMYFICKLFFLFYLKSDIQFHTLKIFNLIYCMLPLIGICLEFTKAMEFANKRSEEANKLKSKLLKFFTLANENPNSILILDNNLKIEFINKSIKSFLLNNFNIDIEAGNFLTDYNYDFNNILDKIYSSVNNFNDNNILEENLSFKNIYKEDVFIKMYIIKTEEEVNNNYNFNILIIDETKNIRATKSAEKSERKFRQVIENVCEFICQIDVNGEITYCSKSYVDALGGKYTEYKGKPWTHNICSEDVEKVKNDIKEAFSNKDVVSNECLMKIENNLEIIVEYYINPLVENETIIGAIISSKDITFKKQIEIDLIKSEKKYSDIFNICPDSIYLIDVNDKSILDLNPAACEFISENRESLIGKSYYNLIDGNIAQSLNIVLEYLSKGYIVKDHPISFIYNGEKKYLEIDYSPIIEGGTLKRVLCLSRDITEKVNLIKLKKEHEKNRRKLNEALEYDKIKTEFFANISHELRTPINVIFSALQFLDLYKNNLENMPYEKYSRVMRQNCYRLLRLISNLIDITKIDAGFFKLSMGKYNIVKVIEEITQSVVTYAENKNITVIFDTEDEEIFTHCDPDKIERIILNLLSNSIKFTNPKGKILVNIKRKEDKVLVVVEDNGKGIPEEKLDSIFERFRQVDKSFTRENEGSGIGLSLVKSLTELHGGSISIKSSLGRGSKFTLGLPLNNDCEIDKNNFQDRSQANIEKINIEFSDIYDVMN